MDHPRVRRPAGSASIAAIVVMVLPLLLWSCAAAPQGDAAAQTEDLGVFERDFFAVDRSYSPEAREQARQRLAALRARVGGISEVQFVLTLSQIVALADNGHTAMISRGSLPGLTSAGIRLTPFGEDFFVVRAVADQADLLGGRLVAIDGVPVERLRESARTLRGGLPSWRDRAAPLLLESPGQLSAMGLTGSASHAAYRFQLRTGSIREAVLTPVKGASGGWRNLVSALDPGGEEAGWRTLLAADRAPWSLREFSRSFRRRDAPELDAMVIQLKVNRDAEGESIAHFLEQSDAERRAAGRTHVVLDMRFNGGGNLQLTRNFMTSLPARLSPDGRIIVLMSPWTFSAAISSIGYLKQAGGDRVVLVGEAPGDRLQFWAEGQPFQLPHSGALVQVATERHDYADGCREFSDCHQFVRRFPIAVRSLAPDVAAPWTIETYASGRDPGMEAAARVLGRADARAGRTRNGTKR